MSFEKIFRESRVILTEGALVERLKAEYTITMDAAVNHAGLIYTHPEILGFLYRQYIAIAQKHHLPVMIMTPTRKVNAASLKRSGFQDKDIISDACVFINNIRDGYGDYAPHILTGGLLGCMGDAYSGKKKLTAEEAYTFHRQQTTQFQQENPDFLFAGIMPEIQEATGMARAMAETGIPYILSFMIQKDGCLLDGTSLSDAIRIIDEQVDPKPVCFMTNCIHPANLIAALTHERNRNAPQLARLMGIQANASPLSPEELNQCQVLQVDDVNNIIEGMDVLCTQFGFRIFGGCCGTDALFMEELAKKLTDNGDSSNKQVIE